MPAVGQYDTAALTEAFELLADHPLPATEQQALWFQGFYRWWRLEGRDGGPVHPIVAERRELQRRIGDALFAVCLSALLSGGWKHRV